MRKLIWIALGAAGACALCAYLLPGTWLLPLAAVFGLLTLLFGVLGRKSALFKGAALLFLGIALGFLWFSQYYRLYLDDAVATDGTERWAAVTISDYSYETDYGIAADGTAELAGKTYQARIYLKPMEPLEPGDRLFSKFRFRVTTPDGKEEATYHQGRGTFLLLYQKGETEYLTPKEATLSDHVARLRRNITDALEEAFPEDTAPFAKALLLGDTADLSYEVDTAFKVSGIRHVVAVSGLHVSILFALLSAVTFRKRFLTALLGFPMLVLFAALAGFTPSVCRSCLMLGLTLLALLTEKEYDGPSALSFAVLVMLAANPLTITDIGFQLSVGSVAGIYLFSGPIERWLRKVLAGEDPGNFRDRAAHGIALSVSTTVSAMTITTPLCAFWFGTVSLVGILTNLLTLWVISFIFYGILAVCLLSLFWPAGAVMAAGILSLPIRYVLVTAKILASFPLAAVYTRSIYITIWLVFVYLLLGAFLRMRRRQPAVLMCCMVIGLCLSLLLSRAEPGLDDVRLTVLDVGQGQCLLLQSEGRSYMVDCGGDSDGETADMAASTLLSQGVSRLDGLILTHLDRDHAGAAANLLSRIDTDLLILPPERSELAALTKGRVIYAEDDLEVTFSDTTVRIFAPTFPGNGNEKSLCVLFDTKKCDILITGDRSGFGERSLLRNENIPQVDVLIAGHHGSKNATCEELLAAVRPKIVCISAGEDNSYGHPAPETLERLIRWGCAVYRTDIHGQIQIRR